MFNQQQIYVWIFDSPEIATATEHAFFTNLNPTPANGDAWEYPTHTGTGSDAVVLDLRTLYTEGDAQFTPGVVFQQSTNEIILTTIPEPSSSLLVAGAALVLLRRRR